MTLPVRAEVAAMFGAGPFDQPGDFYLSVPTGHASTPDAASLDITGDIVVRVEASLTDWSPGATRYLAAKYVTTGNQRSWLFGVNAVGQLFFQWSTDGTLAGVIGHTSTNTIPSGTGRVAVGFRLDVDDGAGNHAIVYEVSDHIGGGIIDFDPGTFAGTTSIFNSSAPVELGNALDGLSGGLGGRIYAAQIRSGGAAGTIVANPDFTGLARGTTSFADTATPAKTWTVSLGASVTGFNWSVIPNDAAGRGRVQSLSWAVGRSNELEWFASQAATVVLRNNDRRYDPDHAGGPHFGDLLPRVPVRIRLSKDSGVTWVDEFYGFVRDGWQQEYDKPSVSRCTLQLSDLLDVLDGQPLPETASDVAVLGSHPVAFWKLDEETGTVMADSSGRGNNGTYDNGEPTDPLVYGGRKGLLVPHVSDSRGEFEGETLPTAPPVTIEAWVKFPRDLAAVHSIVVVQRDHALGSGVSLQVSTSAAGSPNGQLVIEFFGLGGFYKARGDTRIDDNKVHHVLMTMATTAAADVHLWVDGRQNVKTLVSGGAAGSWASHLIWTVGNTVDSGSGDFGLGGTIDEVAVYDRVLSDAEIVEHYAAGTTAFADEATGDRVDRVLDIVGIPTSLRDIAVGDTSSGPFTPNGDSAGAYIAKVVESEQGTFLVAHHDGGKLKFRGRYARLTETRSTTSQATFSDAPGTGTPYREDIAPDPNGIGMIVNVVDVTWPGGTETVADAASRDRYGPQSRTITTDAPSPVAARSAGLWLMARNSVPRTHIRRVPLGPGGGRPGLVTAVLGSRVSDRVTVQRHPQKVGVASVDELIIEGMSHEMHSDQTWITNLATSNADDSAVWIWGTSAWGVDAVWG